MLDWFHITMRITVLGQFLKGLRHAKLEDDAAPLTVTGLVDEMERALESTKWNLCMADQRVPSNGSRTSRC